MCNPSLSIYEFSACHMLIFIRFAYDIALSLQQREWNWKEKSAKARNDHAQKHRERNEIKSHKYQSILITVKHPYRG